MTDYDLIIRNVSIFDGSGAAPVSGDVAVSGDRIAAVGDVGQGGAHDTIDAGGLALAPGFIDVHTHDDRAILATDMSAKTSQGVTSVVAGNCGISLSPLVPGAPPPPPLDLIGAREDYVFPTFESYADKLVTDGAAVNAGCLVGHSTLRFSIMDDLKREATDDEIVIMRGRLGEALDAGSIGLSTGLDYAPAAAAPTSEIQALASVLKPAGAMHATHMRHEGEHIIEAMDEAFTIGRSADVPVVISHFKCSGKKNFGRAKANLEAFEKARLNQPLGLDAYPYAASSTVLKPDYVNESLRVLITWSKSHPDQAGRDLDAIAGEWGLSRDQAAERLQPAGAVYFAMDEADVQRILAYPHTMIGSDGLPHDAHPHPRLWGSFTRVLGHYAREIGLFSMAEAIRKMTSLPASRFGFRDRGSIATGKFADLVLFDPATVADAATFDTPCVPSHGIRSVWVNGTAVWDAGQSTGNRPGRLLRREALS